MKCSTVLKVCIIRVPEYILLSIILHAVGSLRRVKENNNKQLGISNADDRYSSDCFAGMQTILL